MKFFLIKIRDAKSGKLLKEVGLVRFHDVGIKVEIVEQKSKNPKGILIDEKGFK